MVTAEQMQNSGQVDQAILLYEKARRNDPSLKTIAHHLGVLYDLQGDSTRSLLEYKLALEAEPKNPDVYSDVGYYYFKRGNLGDAEQMLRKAVEIDAKHARALTNLGMVLAAKQRFGESFEAFSKVVGPAAAHSNVGVLMAKQGRNDDARKEFHAALASTRRSNNRRRSWNISIARSSVVRVKRIPPWEGREDGGTRFTRPTLPLQYLDRPRKPLSTPE